MLPQPPEVVILKLQVPTLRLNNERFLVPELLFSPSNVGLHQAGLAEAVLLSANKCHPDLRPLLLSNVLCCGGMFKCPGFMSRMSADVRAIVPSRYEVNFNLHFYFHNYSCACTLLKTTATNEVLIDFQPCIVYSQATP